MRGALNEERIKIRASWEPMNFNLSTALLSFEHPAAQASSRTTPGNNVAPSSEASAMEVREKDKCDIKNLKIRSVTLGRVSNFELKSSSFDTRRKETLKIRTLEISSLMEMLR